MSLCDLGRPKQDAGLQNLVVNDTLRVNRLLKATKAEIERLCADVNSLSSVLVGSFETSIGDPTNEYETYTLPSGPMVVTETPSFERSPFTSFWTDEELTIEDFRAVAVLPDGQFSQDISLSVNLSAGTTLGTISPIITLVLPNLSTSPPISGVSPLVPVSIPANSFVSIRLNITSTIAEINGFQVSWQIKYTRQQ